MVLTVLGTVEVKALVMVLRVLSEIVLVLPPLVTVDAEPTTKSVVVPVVVDAGMVVTEGEAAEAAEEKELAAEDSLEATEDAAEVSMDTVLEAVVVEMTTEPAESVCVTICGTMTTSVVAAVEVTWMGTLAVVVAVEADCASV